MAMTFRLKDFDGPLDLLLHLISKQQINIRDIFISSITDQYIEAVHSAPDIDMEEASEFLVMAATLLEIKSRALLPKPPEPVDPNEPDPEEELIRRLEEYQRMKESTQRMKEFEETARSMFAKLPDEFPLPPQETELVGLTLEGLTEAFRRIWARKPAEEPQEQNHYARRPIHRDEHSVEGCMVDLIHQLRTAERVRFTDALNQAHTREAVVTYFLAVLELLKLGELHVEQEGVCGEIRLVRGRAEPAEDEEP